MSERVHSARCWMTDILSGEANFTATFLTLAGNAVAGASCSSPSKERLAPSPIFPLKIHPP
jgi:hypothetical protein